MRTRRAVSGSVLAGGSASGLATGDGATIAAMSEVLRTAPGHTPLVLDSPHSGTEYPQDFGHACDFMRLRAAEDTHVERLYDFAPGLGVAWVEARFPRSYIDVNRAPDEIDPALLASDWPHALPQDPARLAKVRLGKGLIWRCLDDGTPIYARRLSVAEVQSRIERCWMPYHAAVAQAVQQAHARHGVSLHINCHSMPSVASACATDHPGLVHPDFVVGDRDGSTAHPGLTQAVAEYLRARGFSVWVNHPYKGVEIVRRHSAPAEGRHSLQLEVNRRLYMDETTLVPTAGFEPLRAALLGLIGHLLALDLRALAAGSAPVA